MTAVSDKTGRFGSFRQTTVYVAVLALLSAVSTPLSSAQPTTEAVALAAVYDSVRLEEARLATIGLRLATANVASCPESAMLAGVALHSLSSYRDPLRRMLAPRFGPEGGTAVVAVAAGGPGAAAGLSDGDRLVSVDGESVPVSAAGGPTLAETEAWRALIDRALGDAHARFVVNRNGAQRTVEVHATAGCPLDMQLELSDRYIAAANGRRVRVSTAVTAFAASDDELAAVIAHELAHNILHHRTQLDAAGVNRGLAGAIGLGAGQMRIMELEADRLSVRLMAAAGYDPAAAVRYMERLVRRRDYREGPTHPRGAQRLAVLRETVGALPQSQTASASAPRPRP